MDAGEPGPMPLGRMTRAELHAHALRYFKTGGGTEPEVALVAHGDKRAILKDYGRTSGWFNRVLAPLLVQREASALRVLANVRGVPTLYRRLDTRGMLLEYCPARPWADVQPSDAAYDRLQSLVDTIHDWGIAHCDLRSPSNVLVSEKGEPFVVDFVARIRRGRKWNFIWNFLFRQFARADDSGVAKLRMRFAPDTLSDADRALVHGRDLLARIARTLGESTRHLVRFFVRT